MNDSDLTSASGHWHNAGSSRPKKGQKPRIRASRACDRCKARKSRCSGKYPCSVCARLNLVCQYTAHYRRGRLPSIEMDTTEPCSDAGQQPSATTGEHLDAQTDQDRQPQPHDYIPSPRSMENRSSLLSRPGVSSTTIQSTRNSPEPPQTDRQGHYVGPSSGASFLLRIQKKLQLQQPSAHSSDASIFTFGDLPLPEFDPRFLILPSRMEANALLSRYFDFASATHRYLHRPTVELWLQELYETNGAMREQGAARSKVAVLLMVFAMAENFPEAKGGKVDIVPSARYFSAAEDQLSTEKGAIRLTSLQARLMQCLYLLARSRINHCWSLFGTTAHLMLALGIHRKTRADASGNIDQVDLECRKRTFWCAYNLDTYLSAALGRPRTFHDDDIDQELPLCIDDSRLICGQPSSSALSTQHSVMSASVAHIKLSRIVANILHDLYSIRASSRQTRLAQAERYVGELDAWERDVPFLIGQDGIDPSLLQPIFRRQRNVLTLACWHARILVHRPFLLNDFTSLATFGTRRSRKDSEDVKRHVQSCVDAAMRIVNKLDDLYAGGQLYGTFWFSHYFAFCAVVILYVYAIQKTHSPLATYLPAFDAATKCQRLITSIATPDSLCQRYGVVLQELRLELLQQNSHIRALALTQKDADAMDMGPLGLEGDGIIFNQMDGIDGLDLGSRPGREDNGDVSVAFSGDNLSIPTASPRDSLTQITGWGEFDSLVISGMDQMQSLLDQSIVDNWDLSLAGGIDG